MYILYKKDKKKEFIVVKCTYVIVNCMQKTKKTKTKKKQKKKKENK